MTVDEAQERLAKVRALDENGAYDEAHDLEDALLRDFVDLVATKRGYLEVTRIASLLKSHLDSDTRGERWCA